MVLLALPVLTIMSPFIQMFPVGLGLKLLMASSVLVSLIFGLSIAILGFYKHKNRYAYLLFFISVILLISAHINADFTEEQPKPNSLLYYFDTDSNEAVWATYDNILDPWTKVYLSDNPDDNHALSKTIFGSKYNTAFNASKKADLKAINQADITVKKDTIIANQKIGRASCRERV